MIPTPKQVGLPSKFQEWRPGQWEAIQDGINCPSRFVIQVKRPGAGKTAITMSQAILSKFKRIIFLTVQKGLQDQMLVDFAQIGLTDIRGKGSYSCEAMAGHSCDEGTVARCMFKGTSLCTYNSALQDFNDSQFGITNYACWIAAHRYGRGFGKFDMMVCDESHNIPDQVAKAMQVVITEREIQECIDRDWPASNLRGDMTEWKHWALVSHAVANTKLQRLKLELDKEKKPSRVTVKDYRTLLQLTRRLADIGTCNPTKWIVDNHSHGFQFDPIDASEYVEKVLFRGIEKVILTSASIHPKTVVDCGIKEGEYEFFDYPPTSNTRSPLIYIPTTKVNYYSQPWELRRLVKRVDEIFKSRADRKGIIHTENFKIRDLIMEQSKFSKHFISNYSKQGDITGQVVERFKRADPPTLLVSPSIKEGYDLPYDFCRYQIIAKLSFSFGGSKVERARDLLDPERSAFKAWQSLRQAVGRGDRAEDDYQEVFVIDDAMPTLVWKYSHLAAPELLGMYQRSEKVPKPLESY